MTIEEGRVDPKAVLLRLSDEGVVQSLEVREPFPGATDLLFEISGEGMLVMVKDGHATLRLVGRRSESDVQPSDLEQTIRDWAR